MYLAFLFFLAAIGASIYSGTHCTVMEFHIDHIERLHLPRRAHNRALPSDDRVPAFEREPGVQRPQPLIQRSLPGRCQRECVPRNPVEGPEDFVYVLAVLAEDVDRPIECVTVEEMWMRSL